MSKHEPTSTPAATDPGVTGVATTGSAKKPYATPRLEVYGKLTQLTQSTTNASNGDGGSTMMAASDLRLKENVVRIGTHPLGLGLYLFNYIDAGQQQLPAGRHFGVLAQEVEQVLPAAVSTGANGYKQVDYARLGLSCGA